MDKIFSLKLYNVSKNNDILSSINMYINNISSKLFIFVYSISLLYVALEKEDLLFGFVLAPLILLIINNQLRKVVKRKRPQYLHNIIANKKSYSFPSNHSACSSVIATVCFFLNPILGIFMFICSLITGINRIMLGLHYISDVVAGWILGTLFGILGFIFV